MAAGFIGYALWQFLSESAKVGRQKREPWDVV
jgi:hypothetical protein